MPQYRSIIYGMANGLCNKNMRCSSYCLCGRYAAARRKYKKNRSVLRFAGDDCNNMRASGKSFSQQQLVIAPPQEEHGQPDQLQIKQSVEKAITQLIKTVDGFADAQVSATLSGSSVYSVEIYKNQSGAPINKINEQKIKELISVLYKIDENMIYIRE